MSVAPPTHATLSWLRRPAMRRLVTLLLVTCVCLAVFGCSADSETSSSVAPSAPQVQPAQKDPGAGLFVGSVRSNKYHYPDCKWAKRIPPRRELWFSTASDAKAHGYIPCRVCRPPK